MNFLRMRDGGGLMAALSGQPRNGVTSGGFSPRRARADLLMRARYRPTGRIGPDEAGSGPARAVVTRPHLRGKERCFYACMHRPRTPVRHGLGSG